MDRNAPMTIPELDLLNFGEGENRNELFDKFSANDIPNKFSISSKSTQKNTIRDKNKRYCRQMY